jgi:hypothetical protein
MLFIRVEGSDDVPIAIEKVCFYVKLCIDESQSSI